MTAHPSGLWIAEPSWGDGAVVRRDSTGAFRLVAYTLTRHARADAARLALCWNMHDELVGALEALLSAYEAVHEAGRHGMTMYESRPVIAARAAASKAQEVSP